MDYLLILYALKFDHYDWNFTNNTQNIKIEYYDVHYDEKSRFIIVLI